jgi:FkbM family methyltransferase
MIKRLLRLIWRGLHPCIQAFFNVMPKKILVILLYFISPPLNIRSVIADGRMGPMRGSPRDLGVLGEYLGSGTYSPRMMAYLEAFFRVHGSGTFIDIGANIGFTSRPLLALDVACECFEPDPENFKHLAENLDRYVTAGSARLHNVAAYDRPSEMSFERSAWNYGDHRVRAEGSGEGGEYAEDKRDVITVACVRLDDVLEPDKLRRPLVIKIDTQGSEVNVLEGAPRLLAAADLLILEFWPYGIRRQGRSEQVLIEFAESHFQHGYGSADARAAVPMTFGPVADVIAAMQRTAQDPAPIHIDVYLTKTA